MSDWKDEDWEAECEKSGQLIEQLFTCLIELEAIVKSQQRRIDALSKE